MEQRRSLVWIHIRFDDDILNNKQTEQFASLVSQLSKTFPTVEFISRGCRFSHPDRTLRKLSLLLKEVIYMDEFDPQAEPGLCLPILQTIGESLSLGAKPVRVDVQISLNVPVERLGSRPDLSVYVSLPEELTSLGKLTPELLGFVIEGNLEYRLGLAVEEGNISCILGVPRIECAYRDIVDKLGMVFIEMATRVLPLFRGWVGFEG